MKKKEVRYLEVFSLLRLFVPFVFYEIYHMANLFELWFIRSDELQTFVLGKHKHIN